MANLRIWLKYDGTDFHGYQIQKNGYTVQQALMDAIKKITEAEANVIGCSRTDAGVHAAMYCANFRSDTHIPMDKLPLALNTALPDSLRVYKAETVNDDFHATFSAKEKTYEYMINTSRVSDPFTARYSWNYHYDVDIEKMKKAAEYIMGKHDFAAFMAAGGQVKTTVRTVKRLEISKNCEIIKIRITADGFLYNMVRIIVGTLVYCGIGKTEPHEVEKIISSKDRRNAGITAPPQGLCLVEVVY